MAKQVTLKATRDRLEQITGRKVEERLKDICQSALNLSPVDSGAYVESFSIGRAGFGGGRSRSSKGRPTNQNPEAKRAEAMGQLNSDIEAMNLEKTLMEGSPKFTLRNRAPHANSVENGSSEPDSSWRRDGYHVFAQLRRMYG